MYTNRLSAVIGLLLTLFCVREACAQSEEAWVLTNNSLVRIDTANPAAADTPVPVTGLNPGDTLVDIDFRPVNGYLYGLGFNSGAGTVQLYNVSFRTGLATPIGTTGTFVASDGTTPVPITGTNFGIDFNPVVDRLRVVSDSGQNFRINPNTGVFVDGDLGGAPGSVTGLNMDGTVSGSAIVGASGAAYTNNIVGGSQTTLYVLNATNNGEYILNTPNSGNATVPIGLTLNGNPLDFDAATGFDISPNTSFSLGDNAPSTGFARVVLTVGGTTSLYTLNLGSALATLDGPIGTGAVPVQGLAIQAVRLPTECGATGIALIDPNNLAPFNTNGCGIFDIALAVTGMVAGETLVGIDFRPSTGQLFGLGFNASSGTGSATLYLLDPETAAATIVGAGSGVANGSGAPIDLAGAAGFGFDFNPTVDRIRVVTNNGLNFRINPNDGTVVGGALDPPINGLPAGSQGLVGAAYTNSFGQTLGGGVTTLYTLDPASNKLFIQNPANAGTQTNGIPVTLNGVPFDFENVVGFDIAPSIRVASANAPAAGVAHAVLGFGPIENFGFNAAHRFVIDLATGVARRMPAHTINEKWNSLAIGDSPRNPTTLALATSAPIAAVGQAVTFTATITPPEKVGVSLSPNNATGTVAFTAGGVPVAGCGAQPVSGLTATCTTSFDVLGPVQIVGAFSGDGIHRGSTSPALTQSFVAAPSTTSLTVTPNPAQLPQAVTFTATITPSWATGSVTFRANGNVVASAAVTAGTAVGSVNLPEGTYQIVASYSGSPTAAASESSPVTSIVGGPTPLTQHFAEGATGFMQTDIGVFNAHVTNTANVNVKLLPEIGTPITIALQLGPLERQSIDLNAVVRALVVPDQGFSVLVESTQPVAATRQMTWGRPVYGSTLESGIASASPTWYFAEGATNIFSLYYMIENPNATPATVVLTHLLEGGAASVAHSDVIPAFTRRTYDINAVPGLASAALSTIVAADVPIVAERAMYLNTTNRLWEGGAVGRGAPAPSQSWSFAEGSTGFFHTYLCLGNPNDGAANVTVTYKLASGNTLTKTYTVPGKSRRTVDVNGEDAQLASADVGMAVASNLPIVAERAMWWGDFPWTEGTVSIGTIAPGTVWAIGEGAEGGPSSESTFVQVANSASTMGTLRFTVAFDDGTIYQDHFTLLGNARMTVRIADAFPQAVGRKFSVLVESLTTGVPITVEYARYQSPSGFGDGGGAALATRIR